jgi:hypothetical protein
MKTSSSDEFRHLAGTVRRFLMSNATGTSPEKKAGLWMVSG